MYEKLLEQLEAVINNGVNELVDIKWEVISEVLDCIIKVKTIQAMDTSAGLIRESRKVLNN
ncbi:MAG TPA: hypothetical protein ENN27_00560 [Candidatus Atribacteria bacterium]|nr:hypothetical protein [Candidatus Atribacteria bacterium]